MKQYIKYIILSFLICTILYIVEQIIQVSFLIKLGVKPILLIMVPLICYGFIIKFKKPNIEYIKRGLLSGIIFFCCVMIVYFILSKFIDFRTISSDLLERYNITKSVFIWIGLYVIFINSFLEEFFFRGFVFLNIAKENKWVAHIYSALLFSVYHVSIFATWFSFPIMALCLFGLFAVGIFFNLLDIKTNSIIPSWISHIFADIAIIIIGLFMFKFF
jgi:membrane protease YdiL (CAAX protease family)